MTQYLIRNMLHLPSTRRKSDNLIYMFGYQNGRAPLKTFRMYFMMYKTFREFLERVWRAHPTPGKRVLKNNVFRGKGLRNLYIIFVRWGSFDCGLFREPNILECSQKDLPGEILSLPGEILNLPDFKEYVKTFCFSCCWNSYELWCFDKGANKARLSFKFTCASF